MWKNQTVAVVLPTYNERESIADVIKGFEGLGIVDDIIAVNNNAAEGTSEEIARSAGREVFEQVQGYGAAIQRGLAESHADLICICEPDGTFDPADIFKLLAFVDECDFVFGSRTVSNFIWDGANMGWFLRWGNWAVAKLIEVLFNTSSLSDVGCTMRLLTRDSYKSIKGGFQTSGSSFGLEMMLLAVVTKQRIVQVPVNYSKRVGESAVTGDFVKTIRLGTEMILKTLKTRLRTRKIRRELNVA